MPYRLGIGELAVDRLGLGERRSIIEPWLKYGLPAVALEDSREPSAAPASDPAEALAGFLDRFIALSDDGFGDEWDNHYLPMTFGGRTLVGGEAMWVSVAAGPPSVAVGPAAMSMRMVRAVSETIGIGGRGTSGTIGA